MCGIVGLVAKSAVNQDLFDALTAVQHRGQDAAGMATSDADGHIYLHKGRGLVRDVFRTRHMYKLQGDMGIGHVRYPTAGGAGKSEAQPFYVNAPYGIALAHNGTLTNATSLRRELWQQDLRHINTKSDTEVLLNVFAHALQQLHNRQVSAEDVFTAVSDVHRRCRGAYAVVAMITGFGLVGFRDPHGIRPIVYGKRETDAGTEYAIASETVALDALGFEFVDDLAPGEAIYISQHGEIHRKQCAKQSALHPCIFEYVYLSRPDSTLDKISVYKVRVHLGERLADKILRERPELDIDVVMPIPDTSRSAAFSLSLRLNAKYREGFVKNRYIGRTFIMPGQTLRRKSVRQKLNTLDLEFKGKSVLLVDDSIVRGTTCKEIINMAREAGAKKVYFASASPAVRFPNVYGIDMPARSELIAHNKTAEEVCEEVGADWLVYQDLDDLVAAVKEGNSDIKRFEDSIFTGDYITADVDEAYLQALEDSRGGK